MSWILDWRGARGDACKIREFSIKERIEWQQYVNVVMSIKSLMYKRKRRRKETEYTHIIVHTHIHMEYITKKHLSRTDRK